MRVSFVLRFDAEPLTRGQLVGEVEEVSTGRVGGVRSVDDLVGFVTSHGIAGPPGAAAGEATFLTAEGP